MALIRVNGQLNRLLALSRGNVSLNQQLTFPGGMSNDIYVKLLQLPKAELSIIENNSTVMYDCIVRKDSVVGTASLQYNSNLGPKLMGIGEYINSQYNPQISCNERSSDDVNSFNACICYIWLVVESLKSSSVASAAFKDSDVVKYVRNGVETLEHLLLHHVIIKMKQCGLLPPDVNTGV